MANPRGIGKIPKEYNTTCFALRNNNYPRIKILVTGTGTYRKFIGTADDEDGTNLAWQEITNNLFNLLTTPNKALFGKIVGSNGAVMTNFTFDHSEA